MRIGYAYKATNAPALHLQIAALQDEDCANIFQDKHPDRTNRDDMIAKSGVRKGDTLVVVKASILGNGEKDTLATVKAVSAIGVSLQIVGEGEKLYTDEAEMQAFATAAVKVARSANARHMLATRKSTGRPAKWEMTDKDEAVLRILWHDRRVPPEVAIGVASALADMEITRANLALWLGPRDQSE